MTYLVVSHIPLYQEGQRYYLSTEWKRSLFLLQDSLEGKFGPVTLLAPSIPLHSAQSDQLIEEVQEDELNLIAGPDLRGSAKHYWFAQDSAWKNLVRSAVSEATVVHAGIDQLWKPIQYRGFLEACRQNKPTVFVADTDLVTQIWQLSDSQPFLQKIKNRAYAYLLDQVIGWSVGKADLSLLKGQGLHSRYGKQAKNAKDFQDTSYVTADVITEEALRDRLNKRLQAPDLQLVYCGRLDARKGVLESLHLLRQAKDKNMTISLDLIGDGAQRAVLEQEAQKLDLEKEIHFLGSQPYGPALLQQLTQYDALLFTPRAEDTPRMIFDGFAAGLPLLGHDIPYVRELLGKNPIGIVWKKGEGLEVLTNLYQNRSLLADLAWQARSTALRHAADVWYKRRAEWTFEAVKQHRMKGDY